MIKSRKWFIKACDDLWRELVKIRANYRCQLCGRGDVDLEAHHVFGRRAESTRWDLLNGICLCKYVCHKYAHSHVKAFKDWFKVRIGEESYQSLKMRYYKPLQQRMEDVYESLKNEMGRYIC